MSFKEMQCNKGCKTLIHFEDGVVSKSGKKIPLEHDGQYHQCPNALPYGSRQPSNPIQKIVTNPNPPVDQKTIDIKAAQEQRKRENDALITAIHNLTKAIVFQISRQEGQEAREIEDAIGFEESRAEWTEPDPDDAQSSY